MASLREQMKELQKQQEILAKKINEEEKITKEKENTISRLEMLNQQQKELITKYKSKDSKWKGKYELQQARLMTMPRFEVILSILKNQEVRITELENKYK
jgi:hypothetical protein|tara:strand:+ start:122 stop:421 length:300 start_codon:yes stop_codon:yes gene_type:complete